MKKIPLLLLVLLFASGMSFASTHKTSGKSEQLIRGTLEKVDPDAKNITVMPEKASQSKEIALSENATFWTKGKGLKASDLKPGEKVTVYLDTSSNTATKVYVEPTKMSSKTK
jgi:Cu/Ag efflux protein CusF